MAYINKTPHRFAWEHEPETKKQFSRDSDTVKLYHSVRWRKVRLNQLRKEPLCVICKTKGIVKFADTCDHITPVSKGGDFWAESNHQSVCKPCNLSKQDK